MLLRDGYLTFRNKKCLNAKWCSQCERITLYFTRRMFRVCVYLLRIDPGTPRQSGRRKKVQIGKEEKRNDFTTSYTHWRNCWGNRLKNGLKLLIYHYYALFDRKHFTEMKNSGKSNFIYKLLSNHVCCWCCCLLLVFNFLDATLQSFLWVRRK